MTLHLDVWNYKELMKFKFHIDINIKQAGNSVT